MSKQPEAIRLASVAIFERSISWQADATAELKRLHALNAELVEALEGLDEAYCRAGEHMTKEQRHEDRMRLIAARAALKKATEAA